MTIPFAGHGTGRRRALGAMLWVSILSRLIPESFRSGCWPWRRDYRSACRRCKIVVAWVSAAGRFAARRTAGRLVGLPGAELRAGTACGIRRFGHALRLASAAVLHVASLCVYQPAGMWFWTIVLIDDALGSGAFGDAFGKPNSSDAWSSGSSASGLSHIGLYYLLIRGWQFAWQTSKWPDEASTSSRSAGRS